MQAPLPVTFVLPRKMGGVFSYVENLCAALDHREFACRALLTANRLDEDASPVAPMRQTAEQLFEYDLPVENVQAVLRRLAKRLHERLGCIVSNDWIELAALSARPSSSLVLHISHGDYDYYYGLAKRHADDIDRFVAVSARIQQKLAELLPDRASDILHIPTGVRIPAQARQSHAGPVRIIFVGRLCEEKGVLDLPAIDARLKALQVPAVWTVIGSGPAETTLRASWAGARFTGGLPSEQVLAHYADHDLFILPSRMEGLPLTLLEAGAAGVVPIVSDLPGPIQEIVTPGRSGARVAAGDIEGFAQSIKNFHADRMLLEAQSARIRQLMGERHDLRAAASRFEQLLRLSKDPANVRPKRPRRLYGSRLDRAWIPNALVRAVRKSRRALRSAR